MADLQKLRESFIFTDPAMEPIADAMIECVEQLQRLARQVEDQGDPSAVAKAALAKLQAAIEPQSPLPPLARLRDALAAAPNEAWRPAPSPSAINVGDGERNAIHFQGPEYPQLRDLVMVLHETRPGFEEAVERLAWITEFCDEHEERFLGNNAQEGGEREWLRETKAFLARFKGAA